LSIVTVVLSRMKWQLYNKESYSEIYFRGDTPRSFSEWETITAAVSHKIRGEMQLSFLESRNAIYWLSPNAFITHAVQMGYKISAATRTKQNFPRWYFNVCTASQRFFIFASTEVEAFRTLYEMTLYSDFASSFKALVHHDEDTTIKLPTMLLKGILEKATKPLLIGGINFQSAMSGKLLAQPAHTKCIHFAKCEFASPAEEAFMDAMLSKMDKSSGLTELHFQHKLPSNSDQKLVHLMMSENGPTAFSYCPKNLLESLPYSKEVLNCLHNNPRLQSLGLCPKNFTSMDDYASFVSSLNSTSLRSLTIENWDFRKVAFPVEVFQNLSLMHFNLKVPTFDEPSWKNLLQEIPKCTTLEFEYIHWQILGGKELVAAEFVLQLAQFLKDNPNIVVFNLLTFNGTLVFNDNLYTAHLGPILEDNHLTKNLKMLKEMENYKVHGFLVSEALGTWYATKVSSCYRILKENVDVLVSFLSSDNESK